MINRNTGSVVTWTNLDYLRAQYRSLNDTEMLRNINDLLKLYTERTGTEPVVAIVPPRTRVAKLLRRFIKC